MVKNFGSILKILRKTCANGTFVKGDPLFDTQRNRSRNAGVYRKVPIMITGSKFVPPQPYLLSNEMEGVFRFYTEHKYKLHPVLLAASMHQKIVSIHLFIDGDGRSCMLLMNFIGTAKGYNTPWLASKLKFSFV